ncbi:MAG: gliding motility-associated C-terminal domain-containing protein [Paludibacteraceae bacterium]|nr:gliding motility-associated C-terminal domain-containing protein [Paludibacteraceae bacterium]
MKKLLLTLFAMFVALGVSAQFTISGVPVDTTAVQADIDTVFVVDGTAGGRLSFSDGLTHSALRWSSYDLDGNLSEMLNVSDAEEAVIDLLDVPSIGYQLVITDDDVQTIKWVWVFDYTAYPMQLNGITVDSDVSDRCHYLQLLFDYDCDEMLFDSIGGSASHFKLDRYFVLTYDSTYYSEGAYLSETVSRIVPVVEYYAIESPLDDTAYELKGDRFAESFSRAQTVSTDTFEAIAVAIQPEASVRERDSKNELDRDVSTNLRISGSAPLNVEILSHASPAAFFYNWCLTTDRNFEYCEIEQLDTDYRYTFTEKQTYYLRLQVTNSAMSDDSLVTCLQEKIYTIDVMESSLDVPNIFTPNGDGMNDVFKVAYRSLTSFKARVYNVWGRLIYKWDDPADGWDGTIGGKPAAEGAYFYVIEATGDDKDEKGNPIKYYLKGDINLIR